MKNTRRDFLKTATTAALTAITTTPSQIAAALHKTPPASSLWLKGAYEFGLNILENPQNKTKLASIQKLPFIKSALGKINKSSAKIPIQEIIEAYKDQNLTRIKKIEKNF